MHHFNQQLVWSILLITEISIPLTAKTSNPFKISSSGTYYFLVRTHKPEPFVTFLNLHPVGVYIVGYPPDTTAIPSSSL